MSMLIPTRNSAAVPSATPRPRRPRRRFEPIAGPLRVVLLLVYAIPILFIVLTSLKDPSDVISSQSSFLFTPTLEAYTAVLANQGLFIAMQQSLTIMADPDVAAWQRSMMESSMRHMQADVAEFAKQVATPEQKKK